MMIQKIKESRISEYLYLGIFNYVHYKHSLKYISENKKRIQKKIADHEIINVVFIIQFIPGWNKLKPVYDKLKEDNRFNPVILCVPLNIQNHVLMDGKGNDTFDYFVEHGYEVINAFNQDGSWYDLKLLNPDYVFHSRPYNSFMPECYTSGQIVQYALICNVLYGASLTKDGQDLTLNRDYFRDVFVYFSFEKSERTFYHQRYQKGIESGIQLCLPYGSTALEQILAAKPKITNTTSHFRRTILWTPRWSTAAFLGGSNFFNYRDTILELAKKYEDVLFILRPHPLMFNNFISTGEMSQEEVAGFKNDCEKKNNIILDESKEYTDTFWKSDLLITDGSGILPEYFITEKPVLFCHSSKESEFAQFASEMIKSCYEVENKNDLIFYFEKIMNEDDDKKTDRNNVLNKFFVDCCHHSDHILETLAGEIIE